VAAPAGAPVVVVELGLGRRAASSTAGGKIGGPAWQRRQASSVDVRTSVAASEQCGHADERGGRQANEEEDVRVLDRRVGLWRGINVRLNLSLGVGCRQR
jgi:hypothetical protein